ncbi:MAG: type II secretion system F family protein [Rhodospirillaceae bacterium]|nr:type II secretion system F family protein [Rhodospirillaceae bacterium]
MTRFQYEAINTAGIELKGEVQATDVREAHRELKRRGLVPTLLRPTKATAVSRGGRVTRAAEILALGEFATLVEAGLPLTEALGLLAEGASNPVLGQAFAETAQALKRGDALPDAFRRGFPAVPDYVHRLVESGGETGEFAKALRDAVAQMDYEERLRREIRNALVYPLFLIAAGIAAVLFILIAVVPRFKPMFAGRESSLPWLSQVVMSLGTALNDHTWLVLISAAAFVAIIVAIFRHEETRRRLLELASRLPVISAWVIAADTARWASMLATLVDNRVQLLRALELSRGAVRLQRLGDQLEQVQRAVRSGSALSQALGLYAQIDAMAVNLIRVGERSGSLPAMLKSLARLLDETGRERMKRVLVLIEPIAIIAIGGVIGLFVTSIILAITSINTLPL